MTQKTKYNIRILPIFIFMAVLSLSVKINNIFDTLAQKEDKTVSKISIASNQAYAEEQNNKETARLNQILEQSGSANSPRLQDNNGNFSSSEIAILQELAERREALDLRAQEIDRRAVQLKVAEGEIDKKLKQLQEYEAKLKKLINRYNEKEKEQLDSLVKAYTSMKPKDAARIFNTFEVDALVEILKEMKPSASSAILAQMDSLKAKEVTMVLMGNNL